MKNYAPHSFNILFAVCCFTFLKAQTNQLPQQRKKLTVADYKGVSDETLDFLASTYTVVHFQYSSPIACSEKGKIKCKIETKVSLSNKSWMKVSKIRTKETLNELLSHEQGHYDLTEVFAKDLKSTLSNKCFNRETYKKQADSLFQSMKTYYDSLQRRYDSETGHMRNKEMQLKWKLRIAALMSDER